MNCNEFTECVCEIIDKRLSAERTTELLEHAKKCPHCKYEYEALQATKNIVQTKIHRQNVPTELYYAVVNAAVHAPKESWLQKIFGTYFNPAIAFVVLAFIVVGVYSLFIPAKPTVPEDGDIIVQSLKNYQAVVGGSIKPTMVGEIENVHAYLEKEVSFDVHVPKMPGCSWCGGVLSNFKGTKLAHVVYGLGGKKMVYIYQADLKDAMDGTTISLPKEAKDELIKTDWYYKDFPDSTTLVMWRDKNTLCAAISRMDKEQLVALLTEKDIQ
ncbi:MAG: hypothetical protein PHP42_07695 [Bacteroidota bacterium]|nr:hypothetical protein [Bacteroidota bacterium]